MNLRAEPRQFLHVHEAISKIVSVMREEPLAQAISAISWACRSVGKPGNGAVETVTA